MEYAIWSQGLTRRFGGIHAVTDLELRVRRGSITAFLGPNGAGKTTTIRLLLGLIKAHAGTCEVLGYPPGHLLALRQMGAMVETPSLYDHLTGRENVEITRLLRAVPKSETDRVLNLVGLRQEARRPVRGYSLGMRQRLGIALSLMGQPSLLILDEPTNGLDPAGILEIRELIRRLPMETGATVFLSSHLLAEVEQVAGELVVIHRGRLRYQGPTDSLGVVDFAWLSVRVDDPGQGLALLAAQGFTVRQEPGHLLVQASEQNAPRVAACLVGAGIGLLELAPQKTNLESRFLSLLGDE